MALHLIVVEHENKKLVKATLSAVAAASKIPGELHALVLGKGFADVSAAIAPYVKVVHQGEHDGLQNRLAQPWAKVTADLAKHIGATHVWGAATGAGKDLMPRVAAR